VNNSPEFFNPRDLRRKKLLDIRSQFLGGNNKQLYSPKEQKASCKLNTKEPRRERIDEKEILKQLKAIDAVKFYDNIRFNKLSVEAQNFQKKITPTKREEKYPTSEAEMVAFLWKLQIEH
jgi:hypothetical protein